MSYFHLKERITSEMPHFHLKEGTTSQMSHFHLKERIFYSRKITASIPRPTQSKEDKYRFTKRE